LFSGSSAAIAAYLNDNLSSSNDYLEEINENYSNSELYLTFGGDISDDLSKHPKKYKLGYLYLESNNYFYNDGLVPIVSALYDGYANDNVMAHVTWDITCDGCDYTLLMNGYDHSQMADGLYDSDSIGSIGEDELLQSLMEETLIIQSLFELTLLQY